MELTRLIASPLNVYFLLLKFNSFVELSNDKLSFRLVLAGFLDLSVSVALLGVG